MTDPYPPTSSATNPDQHDTAVHVRPGPGQQPGGAGYPPRAAPAWYAPSPAEAQDQHWAARYRRQRTITAVLGIGLAVALAALVGLGVATWQIARSTPLLGASDLAGALGGADGLLPEGFGELGPDPKSDAPADEPGSEPGDPGPDTRLPEGPDGGAAPDLDDVPLPESLRGLGSTLGITDVGELLDLAVANGLISEEAADDLRRVLAAGAALGGEDGSGVS